MEIFGIGLPEIMLILVVALVIFGPEKLPEIAGQMGRMVRQFRQMTAEATSEIKTLTQDLKLDESLNEFKSAAAVVKEEVTTVKNDLTGTLTEQYKVTYETLTDPLKDGEQTASTPEGEVSAPPAENDFSNGTVTVTAREFTEAEREDFNRRRLEQLEFFGASSEQDLINSAVESSPATSSVEILPEIGPVKNAEGTVELNGPDFPAFPSAALNSTVDLTPDYQGAADAGPVEETPPVERPKPRIARRSAFGGARHREQE